MSYYSEVWAEANQGDLCDNFSQSDLSNPTALMAACAQLWDEATYVVSNKYGMSLPITPTERETAIRAMYQQALSCPGVIPSGGGGSTGGGSTGGGSGGGATPSGGGSGGAGTVTVPPTVSGGSSSSGLADYLLWAGGAAAIYFGWKLFTKKK